MNKNRLEAFSDGVLAIIITIMVLEFKVPHGSDWKQLEELIPVFISYGLSFSYIGIYWGNHHHLLHSVKEVSSTMILSNLNLLFWLSLVPFATAWMGENHFETNTVAMYGAVLLLCGTAYYMLQETVKKNSKDSDALKEAFKMSSRKGMISLVMYILAIPLAYVHPYISYGIFIVSSIMWLIPDKNIEKALKAEK
ncbi:MAG: TMEM175 family protein [Paludibacter sp.]